ncbi:unnamed protein product [Adineta ricciae]|uniref:Uncharacterized protein n=1 Tax=Adineta ricciae TaxID=249248 RepID=A0A814WRD0_ADIRI|nr:unnamed protein product [Adineta ricciae]CAF1650837.1 unnamed protein product [Adineta ricciae]
MKNNGTNSSDLQTMMNFNEDSVPEDKHVWFHTLKKLSLSVLICLIILPSVFILIGLIYKDSCLAKPDLPIFLISFGLLILINLSIYTLIGTTFLASIRYVRSFSLKVNVRYSIGLVLSWTFASVIFVWWIIGTVWWIKLALNIRAELKRPSSLALCHPFVYWTGLIANIYGLIGFLTQICIAIGHIMTASK